VAKRDGPSRKEFERLSEEFDALSERQLATQQELAIQFQRIADLQAELDLIRAAWSRLRAKPGLKRARPR
jgi:hypothetical protein